MLAWLRRRRADQRARAIARAEHAAARLAERAIVVVRYVGELGERLEHRIVVRPSGHPLAMEDWDGHSWPPEPFLDADLKAHWRAREIAEKGFWLGARQLVPPSRVLGVRVEWSAAGPPEPPQNSRIRKGVG